MPHRPAFAALAAFSAVACQGYRFKQVSAQPVQVVNQQVTVGAKQKPPDIMIVQDTSGSMCEPIQLADGPNGTTGNSCLSTSGTNSPNYCSFCETGDTSPVSTVADCTFGGATPPACATKMALTVNAMVSVLSSLKPAAGQLNMGLTSFVNPNGETCAPGTTQVPIGDAATTIPEIIQAYDDFVAAGGTPTDATLAVAASDPTLTNPDPTARKFILLVTDGLPNCAQSNACTSEPWSDGMDWACASPANVAKAGSNAAPPPGCTCSFGQCLPGQDTEFCCPTPQDSAGTPPAWYCLDDVNTESEIAKLYASQNITTDVIGMGYDYGSNNSVLAAMAAAGHGTVYQANTPASLTQAITSLIQQVAATCDYTLDAAPVSPDLITVTLNGTPLVAGDPNGYTYTAPTSLTINGTSCTALTNQSGTPENLQITAIAN